MGVPSYFAYLIRNHREMLIKLLNFKKQINNLYFDSNSIVYDGLRFLSKDYEKYKNDTDFERDLIQLVCKYLEDYINEIKPNKRVIKLQLYHSNNQLNNNNNNNNNVNIN